MAIQHDLTITDRIRVGTETLGDGSVQTDCISAVVCIAKATDTDTGEVASTDPWVSIDLSDVTAADFTAFDALTGLPQHAVDQFTAWGQEQQAGLEAQLQARASAPREMSAPWSSAA